MRYPVLRYSATPPHRLIEVTRPQGDGTAIVETIDEAGEVASSQPVEWSPAPDAEATARQALAAMVEAVGAEAVAKAVALGAELVSRTEDLTTALAGISPSNTARAAVAVVAEAAQAAAATEIPTTPEDP